MIEPDYDADGSTVPEQQLMDKHGNPAADCDDCGSDVTEFVVYESGEVSCYDCFEAEDRS